jgi:hypothetical protein
VSTTSLVARGAFGCLLFRQDVRLSPGSRVAEHPLKQTVGTTVFLTERRVYFNLSSRPLLSFSFFDRWVESPALSVRLPFLLDAPSHIASAQCRALPIVYTVGASVASTFLWLRRAPRIDSHLVENEVARRRESERRGW